MRRSFGDDFTTRARVARNWIGTLGIEEAMYIMAEVDEDGQALSGAHRYVLRFPPDGLPKVGSFWSITLYRRSDCLLVANPIGRHSIGDRTPACGATRTAASPSTSRRTIPAPDATGCPRRPGKAST